jgi:hypothetical protein
MLPVRPSFAANLESDIFWTSPETASMSASAIYPDLRTWNIPKIRVLRELLLAVIL